MIHSISWYIAYPFFSLFLLAWSVFRSGDFVRPQFWIFLKTYLNVLKKSEKKHARSQWYILQPCKISMQNTWGFELHKNDKIEDLKLYTVHYTQICTLSFLYSSNPKLFCIENLHGCSIYHWERVWFFLNFLKLLNMFFKIFKLWDRKSVV